MPHYFFDFEENGTVDPDSEGLDLASPESARMEALRTLVEMARDGRPIGDERHLACTVSDGDGDIYRLELTMRCRRLN